MKKFLLTAAVLCLMMLGLSAQEFHDYDYVNPELKNHSNWQRSGNWSYVPIGNGNCALVDFDYHIYNKSSDESVSDFYIPSSVRGLKVTELGQCIFGWSPMTGGFPYSIKRIHIPETVTFISQQAFAFMEDGIRDFEIILDGKNKAYETEPYIPYYEDEYEVGGRQTPYCGGLYSKKDNALILNYHIFSETNPSAEEAYEDYYYEYRHSCFKPRQGTKIIASKACNSVTYIKSIFIPEEVTVLEDFIDDRIDQMDAICIPSGVKVLKQQLLPKGSYIDEENPYFEICEGCIYDRQAKKLLGISRYLRSEENSNVINIKEGTEEVCSFNIYDDMNIKKIIFPDSVKLIGDIVNINVDEELKLPSYLSRIETFLPENVMIPDTCKYSNGGSVRKSNPYLKSENHMLLSKDGKNLYRIFKIPGSGKIVIPPGVENIEKECLYFIDWDSIKEIVFPESIKNIPLSFICLYKSDAIKINIPAGARVNAETEDGNDFYVNMNIDVSVDEKNPYVGFKNGYFYNKENGAVYFYRMKGGEKTVVLPEEFSDYSHFCFSTEKLLETVVVINPETKFGKFNYNADYYKEFNFYVPENSYVENNLSANHIEHETYVPYEVTENLRLRQIPGTEGSSAVITTLKNGSSVMVLEEGQKDIIDDKAGAWVKVLVLPKSWDKDGNAFDQKEILSGWCFNGYLKKK